MSVPPVAADVRPATSDDIDFLADIHVLGQLAVAQARGGELDTLLRGRPEPIAPSFADDLGNKVRHVLIATADELPAGYLVAERITLRNGVKIIRIIDLLVHPDARGIGLGSALMNHTLDLAAEHGCAGVDARALPGDRITKNFFESFGLVARTILVHKAL